MYLFGWKQICNATTLPIDRLSAYYPDADMQAKFCKNELEMKSCPRLQIFEDYLKALQKPKTKRKKPLAVLSTEEMKEIISGKDKVDEAEDKAFENTKP